MYIDVLFVAEKVLCEGPPLFPVVLTNHRFSSACCKSACCNSHVLQEYFALGIFTYICPVSITFHGIALQIAVEVEINGAEQTQYKQRRTRGRLSLPPHRKV